jgi:glycosyltransferase involved in cell wall biosynthesis
MKTLLINKFLYPKGGDAVCTLATGELLRAQGHEAVFWGMSHPDNPVYPNADLFVDNMDLNSAGGIKKQLDIALKLLYSFEAKAKLEKLIARMGKPDIAHVHNFAHQISPSILHVFKKHKIPVVMTMHDYKLVCAPYTLLSKGRLCDKCAVGKYYQCMANGCVKDSRAKSLLNTIEMYLHHSLLRIYDSVHTFISPSAFLKKKLEDMGFKGKIVHIPNFIDAAHYETRYDGANKTMVFLGRLSKEKGVATLINAVKGLDVQLAIVGDGPMGDELRAKVKDEHINNVTFKGYMTGTALKEQIMSARCMVIPSEWYENNPRSVIEAFAMGKPVLGARIGGIPELVRDGQTGFTFEAFNVADLREKIQRMMAADTVTMGKNARRMVETELNTEVHYKSLMKVYDSVRMK